MDFAKVYRSLYRIRRLEEEVERIYPSDKIKSPVHLSIGQEAVAVGVCEALGPDDIVFGTYRGHALYLASGGEMRPMMAELYGKVTGVARGKGGSMHLISPDSGMMGASAIVSTTVPHAVGYALAAQIKRLDTVVVSFFGEGAADEGVVWESINFAALKNLPIIFVCENNGYAIHSSYNFRNPNDNLCERAAAFGLVTERIENNNTEDLYEKTSTVVERLRTGEAGPAFLEVMTYRWSRHVGPGEDFDLGYRTAAEAKPWIDGDQLVLIGERLDPATRAAIAEDVETELADAIQFAETSPFPKSSELNRHVYAD